MISPAQSIKSSMTTTLIRSLKKAVRMITLPLPNSKLINHNNGSWRAKTGLVKKHRIMAKDACYGYGRFTDKVHLIMTIYYPDKRRRDALNTIAACKSYIDGFVDGGLIEDDNFMILVSGSFKASVDRDNPRIEFNFIDIE